MTRTLAIRLLVGALCVSLGFVSPVGLCFHADGGSCLESGPTDCCSPGPAGGATSTEACPECIDLLASSAIPTERPELSDGAVAGPLLAPCVSNGRTARIAVATRVAPRYPPARQAGPAAVFSLPLRC